jgi:hypothetical protein
MVLRRRYRSKEEDYVLVRFYIAVLRWCCLFVGRGRRNDLRHCHI